jgi:hypothetical protein
MTERIFPESGPSTTWNRLAGRLSAIDTMTLPTWAITAIDEAAQRCADQDPTGYLDEEGDDNEGEITNG